MSWREAWALTQGLLRDPDSHTTSALSGWSFVPGGVRVMGVDMYEGYINANRGKNTTPYRAERPWTKKTAAAPGRLAPEDARQRTRLHELLFGALGDPPEGDDDLT